ncbi:MAG: tetratricopeptide repeat protein [Myxococcota bacterium]
MRIVCQKCAAAYAIDDKFVTDKGVRAQCPRCRHLQLVKKGDAEPPGDRVTTQGAASPFLFDLGKPPAPAAAAPAPPAAPSGLSFGTVPPPPNAPPPPAGFSFDFGGAPPPPGGAPQPGSPFDFGSLPPPPPAPSAPPAGPPQPFDFGAPPTSPANSALEFVDAAPPPAMPPPFGAPAAGPGPTLDSMMGGAPGGAPAASAVGKCKTCGKTITDPFDLALGVCDDCRNKAQVTVDGPTPDTDAGRLERVDASGIHQRLSAQQIAHAQAQAAAPAPAPNFDVPPPTAAELGAVRSALRAREDAGRGKVVALIVGVLVVLGIGIAIVVKKPWAKKPPPLVVKKTGGPKPVEGIIQQWRLNYPELQGESSKSAQTFVDAGEELLAKDTTLSYLEAEEEFQKALVLDSGNDRAVAGWVLALAFGRAAQLDEQTARSAESMLTASEQRSGNPRLFVAHAHFLIARGGNPNDIKVLAERGKNSPDPSEKALANLAIGQTFLTKNPQLADSAFKEALELDPKLKRSYFFMAQLSATQGRYKDAIAHLEKRLELDKDQWEAAEELARLYVDVGELTRAKKVLEAAKAAAPRSGRPRIGLAILAYQHLGDVKGAEALLTPLVDDREIARSERADALVHLAILSRLAGDTDRATGLVDRALELSPDLVSARLQRFLVLLDKGVASSARMELDALKGRLQDKYLEATLEGRLMVAEDRLDDAVRVLSGVQESDPRRADALLLAASAAAKARKDGKAWELCLKRGLKLDPGSLPVASLTHLYVRPADILAPASGAFLALTANADEDPNPHLCEGLVSWFAGDPSGAEKHFARVTSIDTRNAHGYAYRAFVALKRKDRGTAGRMASRGLDSSKTNGLVHYANALVLLASNRGDKAKVEAGEALKFAPSLLGAKVVVADVQARNGDGEDARRVLTTVLLNDPLYREAKRVLYKHAL